MPESIEYIGPSRIEDNELYVLNIIMEIIRYSDPSTTTKIHRKPDGILIHILPSKDEYKQVIINNLLWINRELKIKIVFSSSLSISKHVSFTINF